jgi:hypothetical protein
VPDFAKATPTISVGQVDQGADQFFDFSDERKEQKGITDLMGRFVKHVVASAPSSGMDQIKPHHYKIQ